MFVKSIKIGDLNIENNIFLAPMAGVTDLAYRKICKEFGAGLVYTEMVSSRAIFHNDEKTKQLMNIEGEKKPIAVQIFGSDEETMKYATRNVSEFADIIDINMGCPAPKIVKNGDGSKLLLDIEKAEKIIKAVVSNTDRPVTVKFRKGWDYNNIVAVPFAQMAESAGANAITIHGRTRTEFYSGNVDLDIIKDVKNAVNIPVIGNGDIVNEESAEKMFKYTGVDAIMIGRGTFGNPWIFRNLLYYFQTGKKLQEVTKTEKLQILKKHISYELQYKPELVVVHEMRKIISWYTKNLPNSSEFRGKINKVEDLKLLEKEIEEFFNN